MLLRSIVFCFYLFIATSATDEEPSPFPTLEPSLSSNSSSSSSSSESSFERDKQSEGYGYSSSSHASYCHQGEEFFITSYKDAFHPAVMDRLECLFSAGLTPSHPGLGYNYGSMLKIMNIPKHSKFFSDIFGYKKDFTVQTFCHGRYIYFGTLQIGALPLGASSRIVGRLPAPVAHTEFDDGKQSLVIDFGVDVNEVCSPTEGNEVPKYWKYERPFENSLPPTNGFIDVARVVGRDKHDGGLLYIYKAYANNEKTGLLTFMYYIVKNFDPSVKVLDPVTGHPRPFGYEKVYVPTSFTYKTLGLESFLAALGASVDSDVSRLFQLHPWLTS